MCDQGSSCGKTSAGRCLPEPLAAWNPIRDCWETTRQAPLFSEHSDVYSETWPISGMTRDGVAYELPMLGHLTTGSGSSSLPSGGVLFSTPDTAPEAPNAGSNAARTMGNQVLELLATPQARDGKGAPADGFNTKSLPRDVALLPTTTAADANSSGGNSTSHVTLTDAVVRTELGAVENARLLPTPTVSERGNRSQSEGATYRPSLHELAPLLPTPAASEDHYRLGGNSQQSRSLGAMAARSELMATPTARDWKDGTPQEVPTNGILGRQVWTMPEGYDLPPGDALLAEG